MFHAFTLRLLSLSLLLVAPLTAQTFSYSVYTFVGSETPLFDETGARVTPQADFVLDPSGDIYFTARESHAVYRLTPARSVTTFAGSRTEAGHADGVGRAARFRQPRGLARDGSGNLFVADTENQCVRQIAPSGAVTTYIGAPGIYNTVDGTGSAARLAAPWSLALDTKSNLYVLESGIGIRKVTPAKVVTTIARTPPYAGPEATFQIVPFTPTSLAVDLLSDTLYVGADCIYKLDTTGSLIPFAGSPGTSGSVDGRGAAARFTQINDLSFDPAGVLFVVESSVYTLRRIAADGTVSTIAGQPGYTSQVDGVGGSARLQYPLAVAADHDGSIVVLDDSRFRRATPTAAPSLPIITIHPNDGLGFLSHSMGAGTSLTLQGAASGTPPLAFQWRRDGVAIPGATDPAYTISSATAADQGTYSFAVTNAAGSITSRDLGVEVHTPVLGAFTSRRASPGGAFLWSIASSGSMLVAVGTEGTILTSTDGRDWTRRASTTSDWLVGVTYGAGRFVAVGDRGTILLSNDGASWMRATRSGTTQRLNGVTYGDGRFAAVGEAGTVVTSTDGDVWMARRTEVTGWLRGVIYVPKVEVPSSYIGSNGTGVFYASGQGGTLLAGDGITWYRAYISSSSSVENDIETLAAGPVGIGQNGQLLLQQQWQSKVPKSWDWTNGPPPIYISAFWYPAKIGIEARFRGLARGAGAIFAMGEKGIVASSTGTGGPWGLVATGTTANLVSGVFHGNSLFVVGEGETILQSEPLYQSRLMNISTRGTVSGDESLMISGFVVRGGTPKRVLIRGAGPALSAFGVNGALSAPTLTLYNEAGLILSRNEGWGTSPNIEEMAATARAVGAFAFARDSDDAALVTTLPPGSYTAQISGRNATRGISLVEVYDADSIAASGVSRTINISTRGQVGSDSERLIAGLVVSGTASRRVLIRAVGPSLARFGVAGVLAAPRLEVFSHDGYRSAVVDAWSARPEASEIRAAAQLAGAFALEEGSADAAFIATLTPGPWTIQVSGMNNATGTALVEVYDLP